MKHKLVWNVIMKGVGCFSKLLSDYMRPLMLAHQQNIKCLLGFKMSQNIESILQHKVCLLISDIYTLALCNGRFLPQTFSISQAPLYLHFTQIQQTCCCCCCWWWRWWWRRWCCCSSSVVWISSACFSFALAPYETSPQGLCGGGKGWRGDQWSLIGKLTAKKQKTMWVQLTLLHWSNEHIPYWPCWTS